MDKYSAFYETVDRDNEYSKGASADGHPFMPVLEYYKKQLQQSDKPKVLEIGAGTGRFQDEFDNYVAIDVSQSLQKYFHKPYVVVKDGQTYPFPDEYFDLVFTYAVFEHIPSVNLALKEAMRVTKPNGAIIFRPAWNCRPWAANGYSVRPYSDFDLLGKIYKSFIPIRNNIMYRAATMIPARTLKLIGFCLNPLSFKLELKYKTLKPNYDQYWVSDSDACNSIDPFSAILFFRANGYQMHKHPNIAKQFFVRTGELIAIKQPS